MAEKLFVTFVGPGTDRGGVRVDYLVTALNAVQGAARITANDLAARAAPNAAKPPSQDAADAQCDMRLVTISDGSFVAELELESSPQGVGEYASRALDAILRWDGYEDSSLPIEAMKKLHGIYDSIPMDMRVWLGDVKNRLTVEVKNVVHVVHGAHTVKTTSESESALLYGWLKEVNWARQTAQLHRYGHNGYISLRFDESLHNDMLGLATRHVEVRGVGKFNDAGDWTTVLVDSIDLAESGGKPFDMDAFLNNPNPKIFRSEDVIRANVPFDVDAFNRSIREGRDV